MWVIERHNRPAWNRTIFGSMIRALSPELIRWLKGKLPTTLENETPIMVRS